MNAAPTSTEEFESHRKFLRGLAYRMLGSVADAEDAVQDCWLRWHDQTHATVMNPRAFLAQIITRLSLDRLRGAQTRKETYVGVWLPEPWVENVDTATPGADQMVAFAQDLEIAFLLVLQRLTPSERAVFLLNEVFEWDYDQIAQVIDRSPAACRQLASRARQQMAQSADDPPSAGTPDTSFRRRTAPPSFERATHIANSFSAALLLGDVQALAATLAEDVTLMTDGGGKANAVPRPLQGAPEVAQVLVGFARLWAREPGSIQPAWINGTLGAVFHDALGQVLQTMSIELTEEGLIRAVYVVRNPDKLRHIPSKA